MKKARIIGALLLLGAYVCSPSAYGQSPKQEMRVAYILKNIGVKKDTQQKLRPILFAYLKDKKAANQEYDDLKDKYKSAIKSETITEKQAEVLLTSKWACADKENAVKKSYMPKFRSVLSWKKTLKCFDLLNDKSSKVEGRKKSHLDNDDDE